MYTVIARRRPLDLAISELPPLLLALILADNLFVFHRFSLECLAFLATWYALSWLQSTVMALFRRPQNDR